MHTVLASCTPSVLYVQLPPCKPVVVKMHLAPCTYLVSHTQLAHRARFRHTHIAAHTVYATKTPQSHSALHAMIHNLCKHNHACATLVLQCNHLRHVKLCARATCTDISNGCCVLECAGDVLVLILRRSLRACWKSGWTSGWTCGLCVLIVVWLVH